MYVTIKNTCTISENIDQYEILQTMQGFAKIKYIYETIMA